MKKFIAASVGILATALAFMAEPARAGFMPIIDEFWITKCDGCTPTVPAPATEIFRDPFNDGNVPPSGPEDGVSNPNTYFVEGPAGMVAETGPTAEPLGKLTMDPSLGLGQLTPEGFFNVRTAARRLRTNTVGNPQSLEQADYFSINGLFDLSSLPDVAASGFGVRIEDRGTDATGKPLVSNDIVLLEVARSRTTGNLLILFQELDFELGNQDVLDAIDLQSILDDNLTATQIQLSITKAAGTNEVDGFFTIFDNLGAVLVSQDIDNVGEESGVAVTIYDGEGWTRGSFQARTQIPVPEPSTLAIFGLGLAGLGFMRRRRRTA